MISILMITFTAFNTLSAQSTITTGPSAAQASAAITHPVVSSLYPLTAYSFTYPDLPYQVNPFAKARGPQSGYNVCDNSTLGPTSLCQTLFANSLDAFCLYGSPVANGTIGNEEAAVVAYCTNDKFGTRVMPAGTITAAQFMRTSQYIQVVGLFDQTGIGLNATDYGGELDPHGADGLGNPVGALVYSSSLPSGDNVTIEQSISWTMFVGNGIFCFKLCGPMSNPNYCQNVFDLIGCSYNAPAAYLPDSFTSCEGDLQDPAGIYTGANGVVSTWVQPATLSPGTTLPWKPRVPASSNCVTYQSTDLYTVDGASIPAATMTVGPFAVITPSAVVTSRTSATSTATALPRTTASSSTAATATATKTSGVVRLSVDGVIWLIGTMSLLIVL